MYEVTGMGVAILILGWVFQVVLGLAGFEVGYLQGLGVAILVCFLESRLRRVIRG